MIQTCRYEGGFGSARLRGERGDGEVTARGAIGQCTGITCSYEGSCGSGGR
jgi:hypothetical protein